jgi:restriction system protein
MSLNDTTVWGIHGGRTGDADSLFLQHNCVALGWHEVGDLSRLPAERDAFKSRVGDVYPDWKTGKKINGASQLFRFVHEMREGDLVCYPSKADRQIHIGKIAGRYQFDSSPVSTYPNRRATQWLTSVPRTNFTQGALYEIGSALSLFQLKNYADEFRAVVEGTSVSPPTITEDETVTVVAEDIEENARDFVLKKLARELKGHPFADFVAHLLRVMGYKTRVSPAGPDGGVDIVAHKDELGFEPPLVKVQVKSTEGTIGDPEVSQLIGKLGLGEYGLFVTLGVFSPSARSSARSRHNLRLIDGNELVDLIFLHYEHFDSSYKALVPLKRVYVPEVLEESEA